MVYCVVSLVVCTVPLNCFSRRFWICQSLTLNISCRLNCLFPLGLSAAVEVRDIMNKANKEGITKTFEETCWPDCTGVASLMQADSPGSDHLRGKPWAPNMKRLYGVRVCAERRESEPLRCTTLHKPCHHGLHNAFGLTEVPGTTP